MQLPFYPQEVPFRLAPSQRLARIYDEPEPPLAYAQAYFSPLGFHLQLKAYQSPQAGSAFCFTLISGRKLLFSRLLKPGRREESLSVEPLEGRGLLGPYWGCRLLVPRRLWGESLSGIIGLFQQDAPLCFLEEEASAAGCYPVVPFIQEPRPVPSSEEIPPEDQ